MALYTSTSCKEGQVEVSQEPFYVTGGRTFSSYHSIPRATTSFWRHMQTIKGSGVPSHATTEIVNVALHIWLSE